MCIPIAGESFFEEAKRSVDFFFGIPDKRRESEIAFLPAVHVDVMRFQVLRHAVRLGDFKYYHGATLRGRSGRAELNAEAICCINTVPCFFYCVSAHGCKANAEQNFDTFNGVV